MIQEPVREGQLNKQKKWIQTMSIFSSDEEDLEGIQPVSDCTFNTGPLLALRFPYPMISDDSDEEDFNYSSNVNPASGAMKRKRKKVISSDEDDEISQENNCYKHEKRKKYYIEYIKCNKINNKYIKSQILRGEIQDSENYSYNKQTEIVEKSVLRNYKWNPSKQSRKVLDSITAENVGNKCNKPIKKCPRNNFKSENHSRTFHKHTHIKNTFTEDDLKSYKHSTVKNFGNSTIPSMCTSQKSMKVSCPLDNKKKTSSKSASKFLDSSSSGDSDSENNLKSTNLKSFKPPRFRRLRVLLSSSSNSDTDDPNNNLEQSDEMANNVAERTFQSKQDPKQILAKNQNRSTHTISSSESEQEQQCSHSRLSSDSESDHNQILRKEEKSVTSNQNLTKSSRILGAHPFENLIKNNYNTESVNLNYSHNSIKPMSDVRQVISSKRKMPRKAILLTQPPALHVNTSAWKNIANNPLKHSQTKSTTVQPNKLQSLKKQFVSSNVSSVEIYKKIQSNFSKDRFESIPNLNSKCASKKLDDFPRDKSNTFQLTNSVQRDKITSAQSVFKNQHKMHKRRNSSILNSELNDNDNLASIERHDGMSVTNTDNVGKNIINTSLNNQSIQFAVNCNATSSRNTEKTAESNRNVGYSHNDSVNQGNQNSLKVSHPHYSKDNNEREMSDTKRVDAQPNIDLNSVSTENKNITEDSFSYRKKVRHSLCIDKKTHNNRDSQRNSKFNKKHTKLHPVKTDEMLNIENDGTSAINNSTEPTKCDLLSNIISQMDSNPYKIQKPFKNKTDVNTSISSLFPSPQGSLVLAGQSQNPSSLLQCKIYNKEKVQIKFPDKGKNTPVSYFGNATTGLPTSPSYNSISRPQKDKNNIVIENKELGKIHLLHKVYKDTQNIENKVAVNEKSSTKGNNFVKQPEKIISFYSADNKEYTTSSAEPDKLTQENSVVTNKSLFQIENTSENKRKRKRKRRIRSYVQELQNKEELQAKPTDDIQVSSMNESVCKFVGATKKPITESPLANITRRNDNGEVGNKTNQGNSKGVRLRFNGIVYNHVGNIPLPKDIFGPTLLKDNVPEEGSLRASETSLDKVTTSDKGCNVTDGKTSSSSEDSSSSDESENSSSNTSEDSSSESGNKLKGQSRLIVNPSESLKKPLTEINIQKENVKDKNINPMVSPQCLNSKSTDVSNLSSKDISENSLISSIAGSCNNDVTILSGSSNYKNVGANDGISNYLNKTGLHVRNIQSKSNYTSLSISGNGVLGSTKIRSLGNSIKEPLTENKTVHEENNIVKEIKHVGSPQIISFSEEMNNFNTKDSEKKSFTKINCSNDNSDVIVLSGSSDSENVEDANDNANIPQSEENTPFTDTQFNDSVSGSNMENSILGKIRIKSLEELGVAIKSPLPANALSSQLASAISNLGIQQISDLQSSSSTLSLNVSEINDNIQLSNISTSSKSVNPKNNKKISLKPVQFENVLKLKKITLKPVQFENVIKLNKIVKNLPPAPITTSATRRMVAVIKPVNLNENPKPPGVILVNNQTVPVNTINEKPNSNITELRSSPKDERPVQEGLATSSNLLQPNNKKSSQASIKPLGEAEILFFKLCDELFTDVVLLKIPKLVDDLHLLIAYEIMKEERLKKIDQLTSSETIAEEKRRANKDFADVLKIRGQSFVPLFSTIVSRIKKTDMKALVIAVYCRIVEHLERIDPVNSNYRYKLRNIIRQMIIKYSTEMKEEICTVFSQDDKSFKVNFEFINDLLRKYDEHLVDRLANNNVGNIYSEGASALRGNTSRNEPNKSYSGLNSTSDSITSTGNSENIEILKIPPQLNDQTKSTNPPIGNLDQLFLNKERALNE